MVGSRTATALAGLTLSLLVSVVAWYYFGTFLLFLFVPFVPFFLRRRTREEPAGSVVRECPSCGFQTGDPRFEFCPRDGTRLE